MPDFHLNYVPTFTLLSNEAHETMEQRLSRASQRIPIGVIVPALFSDLASPAMANIIQELKDMEFIQRVYISLDRASFEEFQKAQSIVAPLEEKACLLWNDNSRVQAVMQKIDDVIPLGPRGKGRAVWTALGYVLTKEEVAVLAFHDADILTYNRSFMVRLLYAVVQLRYQFAKGFYARYGDRLYGRVLRLFYFPLVRALREILGHIDFLEYMADFRYPLSGEFATFTSLAREMQFPSDWGIEVGILSEIYRLVRVPRICQVELVHRYDHKHQQVGADANAGLKKMAADIARTFFAQLSAQGIVLSNEFFRSLKLTYLTNARNAIGVYEAIAEMHDLNQYDLHVEISAVEAFAQALDQALNDFHQYPFGSPLIPDWRRVEVAIDGIMDELTDALDNPL
ncbi:glucosyl-3-phosphoglycerate synthase [Pseudanabaena sp. FACHB-2040]|uniref:glucosyl-3-phosphoglycerate synthase n=1 Tax=Pseudanabaena sp. FACHB-2040 TaxID=2692859 RepID=UPI001685CBE4|nr:glucosyl-3-phosphoglycerate synthase [Pseudanabaena sp. FACHB-2040]MBD0269662.1 glucosyl-3-phosphoglycerate synthase [Cyanobacteria bacterium Co-bin8]MBD2256756.1 glucosyl-3-phosphoglycerate synthase [Pseudanabaena sp. FACHB-2040]